MTLRHAKRAPRAPRPKRLEQQQTDFTAEGSPPPGKVATDVPETSHATVGAPKRPLPVKPR